MAFQFKAPAPAAKYKTSVAYFSMEFALDQALKSYSGGLGFLAGSHMRSAYELKQNLIGIGILWTYGYYDQVRDADQSMKPAFIEKNYSFLQDTGIVFPIIIHDSEVHVKALYLAPETFGTAPMFFLTTDIEENDFISRTISHHLYDPDTAARVAQSMLLGIGGGKLLDVLGRQTDLYHLNEGHGLPLAFYLFEKHGRNLAEVRKHPMALLQKMSFFCGVPEAEVRQAARVEGDSLNYTLTALRFAKKANGVSKVHGRVANEMWGHYEGICPIISITNAQNGTYWRDTQLAAALKGKDDSALLARKKELKKELFKTVADQTGTVLDPEVLTIVWARRFASYKRADLILRDWEKFERLVTNDERPVQVIWAGKPYPKDFGAIDIFNHIIKSTKELKRCAVLVGYELDLSAELKKGSDLWLNTPRYPREASGTSGMTAAMNACVSVSIADGWIPEFAKDGENCFIIEHADEKLPENEKDTIEANTLYNVLEKAVALYYDQPQEFTKIRKAAMKDVEPTFESGRMAKEYYEQLYK
jgi:starch phosphorylase